jgi:hypothetical protein
MNDAQWLPIQAVEGLLWRRGAYYVDKHGQAYRMDNEGFFPYGHPEENGTYESDLNPGMEYYVDDPLRVFEALANAGSSYGLSVYRPQYVRDGVLVARKGKGDNRLLRFIRDYGLPSDIRLRPGEPVKMGYVHDAFSGIGHSDIGHGSVGHDLRTTAAMAHQCWSLWEGLRKLEEGDRETKSRVIKKLMSHLHEIDTSTLDERDFYEGSHLPEHNQWTFFPRLSPTSGHGGCYWATFTCPDATSEEVLLRHGVYTTISKVAQWYLSFNVVLASLNGEASPPQMMVRMRGLLSYLWMHFLHAVVSRGIPKFYLVQCRQDRGANGCGRWFYSESAKVGQCPDCQTIVNRIEQRIKRDPSLKGQKNQLIDEERNRILQAPKTAP